MFKVARISFHNWFLLQSGEDVDLRGHTALLGASGVGKSAIIDGAQTVITGNNRHRLHLNHSAGVAHTRTVAAYCLGRVGEENGIVSRPDGCDTILALTFRDERDREVAIGLLLTIQPGAVGGEDIRARFVIKGHGFSLADFTEKDADGNSFIPGHDELLARMKQRYGKALTLHPNSRQYVHEYLVAMRPKNPPEPDRFLRTFGMGLSAKEITNPTDFVRRFVLPERPLDVAGVRLSINTWKDLQAEVSRIEKMLAAARGVRARYVNWAGRKIGFDTQSFRRDLADLKIANLEIREAEQAKIGAEQAKIRNEAEVTEREAAIKRHNDENLRDEVRRLQSDEAQQRRGLEDALKDVRKDRDRASRDLLDLVGGYARAQSLAQAAGFLPASVRDVPTAAAELARRTSGNPADWGSSGTEIRLLAENIRLIVKARQSLSGQYDAHAGDLRVLKEQKDVLEQRIRAAGSGGPLLSQETLAFRAELAQRGIRSTPLPDVVDVSDPEWAFAMEALLGPNREALIVHQDHVREAHDLLYRNRHRYSGCRVVNTRKTQEYTIRRNPGSIAEMAVTDDPDALAFIWQNVGRYQRVNDARDLDRVDNGVMVNGKTSAGTSLRVFRDRAPILGKTAQAAALQEARTELAKIEAEITEKDMGARTITGALQLLQLIENLPEPKVIEEVALAYEDARVRTANLDRDIKEMGEDDPEGLFQAIKDRTERIEDMAREIRIHRAKISDLEQEIGGYGVKITELQGLAAKHEANCSAKSAGQLDPQEQRLIEVAGIEETILSVSQWIENKLGIEWKGREKQELRRVRAEAAELTTSRHTEDREIARRHAYNGLVAFVSESRVINPPPADASEEECLFWIDSHVDRLERNELIQYRTQVEQARDEVEKMLKEDLLAKLNDRLEFGRHQIDQLNRRLVGHRFLGQTYQFTRRTSDKFKPLVDLARKVASTPQLDFGALQEEIDSDLRGALERIEEIVGSDMDTGEIEDYRNYAEYDLQIRSEQGTVSNLSSAVGNLSGGQRQAPYYVAIAASVISTYYPGAGSGARVGDTEGFGVVVFDEAFNRLDVITTQRLIRFYEQVGLQCIVAAPEDKRPTFLEAVNTIVNVVREDNSPDLFVETVHIGPAAKQAMRAANPEHVGIDGYRARMAAVPAQASTPAAAMPASDEDSFAQGAAETILETATGAE